MLKREAGVLPERRDTLQAVPSERVVDALNMPTPSDVRSLPTIAAEKGTG
jgi:hypothetical protein